MQTGKQSVTFSSSVYITHAASVVGSKEGQGPLGKQFDLVVKDDMLNQNSWEEAESAFQKKAVDIVMDKANTNPTQIDLLLAGDLLGQSIASSFGTADFPVPHIGLYGACSTCGLTLLNAASWVSGGHAKKVICVTSSHFASAEKEFRFPLAYGNQRPESSTWTVTGSGAFLLSDKPDEIAKSSFNKCNSIEQTSSSSDNKCNSNKQAPASSPEEISRNSALKHENSVKNVRILAATIGKIVDYGIKDSMNMGACMAPAAASTIAANLQDLEVSPHAYDKIITGDLGTVGQTLLYDLLWKKHIDIQNIHMDCGVQIYDKIKQGTHAGGSGCGCSAVTLAAMILPKLVSGEWKKVLFVPTGALLSKTSFNEGMTIPGIAHGVVLEGE